MILKEAGSAEVNGVYENCGKDAEGSFKVCFRVLSAGCLLFFGLQYLMKRQDMKYKLSREPGKQKWWISRTDSSARDIDCQIRFYSFEGMSPLFLF